MNLIYTAGAGEANYTASSEVCELCKTLLLKNRTLVLFESFYHQVLEMFGFQIITA